MLVYQRVDYRILKVPSFWTQHSSQPRSCHAVVKRPCRSWLMARAIHSSPTSPSHCSLTAADNGGVTLGIWVGLYRYTPIYMLNYNWNNLEHMFKTMNVWDFVWFSMGFCISLSYSQNPGIETGSMACRWLVAKPDLGLLRRSIFCHVSMTSNPPVAAGLAEVS